MMGLGLYLLWFCLPAGLALWLFGVLRARWLVYLTILISVVGWGPLLLAGALVWHEWRRRRGGPPALALPDALALLGPLVGLGVVLGVGWQLVYGPLFAGGRAVRPVPGIIWAGGVALVLLGLLACWPSWRQLAAALRGPVPTPRDVVCATCRHRNSPRRATCEHCGAVLI